MRLDKLRLILLMLLAGLTSFSDLTGLKGQTRDQESEALTPQQSFLLHEDLEESSGLIYWEGSLWTHNDSHDNNLYRMDPSTGDIAEKILLAGVENTDWEDIAQDRDYIYMGDIGNNSGNRKDLQILRVAKNSLGSGSPEIDLISFIYEDQADFTPRPQATDWDCEAMLVHRGQIILFTKEWITAGTSIYTLPASPGRHRARKISRHQLDGLVTGADISDDGKLITLCGYTSLIQPFICLLRNPGGKGLENPDRLWEGMERIPLALPYHQVEGIALKGADEIYLSNEYLKLGSLIRVPQQLHLFSGW